MRSRLRALLAARAVALLNGIFALFRAFVEGWRLWVGFALAGALLMGVYAVNQPVRYRSEGTITLTPRFLLEGYLLATQDLTRHYAARLASDARIERAMGAAGSEIEPIVEAEGQPGMLISLSVEHPSAPVAESITRAMMIDLRDEIRAENRARMESDRLTVELSLTSFPHRAAPPWWQFSIAGAVGGFLVGAACVYLRAWQRHGRLRTEREVRQATGAPVLGVIPGR